MTIDVIPTLIDQYRETFEGRVNKGTWIVDTKPGSGVFGLVDALSAEQAFASPCAGAKPIAAHVAHLRFALDATLQRLEGHNPQLDWASSFNVPPASAHAWEALRRELHRAYEAVTAFIQARRDIPPQDWPAINLVGLAAMTAHNAYHLGAMKQIAQIVRPR